MNNTISNTSNACGNITINISAIQYIYVTTIQVLPMKRNNEIKRLVKSINDKITKNEQLVFLFQELFEEIKEELNLLKHQIISNNDHHLNETCTEDSSDQ